MRICVWILVIYAGVAVTAMEEMLVSVKGTDNMHRIIQIQGDPYDYLPKLQAGGSMNISSIRTNNPELSINALAVHHSMGLIAWSNEIQTSIQSLPGFYSGLKSIVGLHSLASDKVHGLSIDWLANNLYWTDATFNRIMMVALDKTIFHVGLSKVTPTERIVHQHGLWEPWGITVHPQKSFLFWTDRALGLVERSTLFGTERKTLVSAVNPKSLTIDVTTDMLYWHSDDASIWKADIHGFGKTRLLTSSSGHHFQGLMIYREWIFTVDRKEKRLRGYNINEVTNNLQITPRNVIDIYDIAMYSEKVQPNGTSPCKTALCEHLCVGNEDNSVAECLCSDGYEMNSNGQCVLQKTLSSPRFLYVGSSRVCHFHGSSVFRTDAELKSEMFTSCFLNNINYQALAYDILRGFFYVYANNDIVQLNLHYSKVTESRMMAKNVPNVKGMTVDWVNGNLYWTDSVAGKIMVASSNEKYVSTVYNDLFSPQGIAADPENGQLYWSSYSPPAIQSGSMSGGAWKTLLSSNMGKPRHLTYDPPTQILYWTDSTLGKVEAYNTKTMIRQSVFSAIASVPFGITVYQDHVVWTDRNTNTIRWMSKHNNTVEKILTTSFTVGDIIMWDEYAQNPSITNACATGQSCDQICLPGKGGSFSCACTFGYTQEKESKCISETVNDDFFLVADTALSTLFQVERATGKVHAIKTGDFDINDPIAVDFDPSGKRVYWSDVSLKTINSVNLDGSDPKVDIKLSDDSIVDGIVLDHKNKWLYYTDTYTKAIHKMRYDGSHNQMVLSVSASQFNNSQPRDIVIATIASIEYMYWSDWGATAKIERSRLDGSERRALITTGLGWPNGLAVDVNGNEMCWCDAKTHQVGCANLDGTNPRTLYRGVSDHFFGIVLTPQFIYLTSWTSRALVHIDRSTGTLMSFGEEGFIKVNGLHYYTSDLSDSVKVTTTSTPAPSSGSVTTEPNTIFIVSLAIGGLVAVVDITIYSFDSLGFHSLLRQKP